jgi:hypothetical protein
MHSLIFIVGVVLTDKENYLEWFRKIKHTSIFNDRWDELCEEQNDNEPIQRTREKELVIWKNKEKKAYALIAVLVSEEVSRHLV